MLVHDIAMKSQPSNAYYSTRNIIFTPQSSPTCMSQKRRYSSSVLTTIILSGSLFCIMISARQVTGFQPSFRPIKIHDTSTFTLMRKTKSSSTPTVRHQPNFGRTIYATKKSDDNSSEYYDEVGDDDYHGDEFNFAPASLIQEEMDFSSDELEVLTVNQLRQQLRLRGLKVGGKKSELITRLLGGQREQTPINNDEGKTAFPSKETEGETSKAREFAKSKGKELIDVSEYLDENDKRKETKSSLKDKDGDNDDEYDSNRSESPETWGDEAKIIDDFENRSVVVDNLSRTVVEFKGSKSSKLQAYVVASRDSLKTFLAGGDRGNNSTDLSNAVRTIQLAREKANKVPMRLEDAQGEDVDDEEGFYSHILDRDYGDYGDYSTTGAQLSAQEVKGVLLLSDVFGPFSEDTKVLADKIAFECQPCIVFAPDLFRGNPWNPLKVEGETELNARGETYEEWRASHDDQRVSVDVRAAAASLREQYGVSSISLFGQCYGGGRALEAAARAYPKDTMDDVGGERGPPHVNPSTCIVWYPTRYQADALFGKERGRTDERNTVPTAIMAIFAEEDKLAGATPDDAAKLKDCLETDERVKDFMVKKHGFAHIGISSQPKEERDSFIDEEFGGSPSFSMESGDAEVACLLSTAWMETYSRVFLPTTGEAVKENDYWSDLSMPDLTSSKKRNIRNEIEQALANHQDPELDLERMHPDDFNNPFEDLDPPALKTQPFGLSLEDDPDTFLDKLEAAIDREDVDFLPGFGNIPLDDINDLGKAYW